MFDHKTTIRVLIILAMSLGGCSSNGNGDNDGGEDTKNYLEITVVPTASFQTMTGFGASDAWSTQFVGKNWPLEKREAIADLLFSRSVDQDGNPRGIGLNSWRFNIGAGSQAQGASSGISDEWRRAESFLTIGGYDWTVHEGQRWFLQAARERGVTHFTAFSNSPPVTLTKNGLSHSSGGSSANLEQERYSDFADFLVEVLANVRDRYGIEFDYVSPFNEPQWDWTGGQEGSPWLNSEIATFTRLLDAKLSESSLQTTIELAEAGKLNYLYEDGDKPARGSQLQEFFDLSSEHYIGNLSSLEKKIAGHSYYTTYGTSNLVQVRKSLADKLFETDPALEFWMTEYCLLENNGEIQGNGRDLGIDPAIYLGRVIHTDLSVANASSWYWWLAVSPYDFKDGLVYIDKEKQNGQIYESKILWALGNFSRFIEEGFQRVGIRRSDGQEIEQSINGLLITAFKSPDSSKTVVVLVNQRTINIPVQIRIEGKQSYSGRLFQTSAAIGDDLAFKGSFSPEETYSVPARSLVTLVME